MNKLLNSINKLSSKRFWDEKTDGWIDSKKLATYKNFIAYGDDGGDTFIIYAIDEAELIKKVRKHLGGDTNCDFDTSIYLIVQNGVKKEIVDYLK